MISQKQSLQKKYYQIFNQISQLSIQNRAFIVFTFSINQKNDHLNQDPNILIFRDRQNTFEQLMKKFKKTNSQILNENQQYCFSLQTGYLINPKHKVLNLQKQLQKDNIDGLFLYIQKMQEKCFIEDQQDDEDFIMNECAIQVLSLNTIQKNKQQYEFDINFYDQKRNKYLFNLKLQLKYNAFEIKQKFIQKWNQQFVNKIQLQDIQEFYIKRTNQKFQLSKTIQNQKQLYKGQIIETVFHNEINLSRIKNGDQILTIYSVDNTSLLLQWHQIKSMKLSQLIKMYFQLQDLQKIYLRINDLIVAPFEILSDKISLFFQSKLTIKISGRLIYKKYVFYKYLSEIDTKKFDISRGINNKSSPPNIRQTYRMQIKSRIPKIRNQYFKNVENIEPIYIYTSDLMRDGKLFYMTLNQFLRKQIKLNNQKDFINDWDNQYTAALIEHLKEIKQQQLIVYRGQNYDFQRKVGDIQTFQSFISTSIIKETAINFAFNMYQEDKQNKKKYILGVLYIIKIKSGRNIKQYSKFQNQDQYLLLPFTEVRITKIEQDQYQYNQNTKVRRVLKTYHMQQVYFERKVQKSRSNIIIWIDKQIDEGQQIFRLLNNAKDPVALIQLNQNQQLSQWISSYKKIIDDPTSVFIFITNMCRQNNQIAGIQAVKIFRQTSLKCRQSPVLFYIGDIDRTIQKLKKHKINMNNVQVCNQPEKALQFLKKYVQMKMQFSKEKSSFIFPNTQNLKQNPQNSTFNICEIV